MYAPQKPAGSCSPVYDTYCLMNYQNGHCDKGCDTEECDWDGLDCDHTPLQLLPGKLFVIILMPVDEFMLVKVCVDFFLSPCIFTVHGY